MDLEKFAKEIRLTILEELNHLGFGHYGGALSIVETLAVLFGEEMNFSPENVDSADRDYFVLSKGHAGPALYAVLMLKGFFNKETLFTLNTNGTKLPSHPNRVLTPGIDMSTGSLGQGISAATGIAYGNMLSGFDNYTFTICGDGEMNEGQCWEAIQFAAHNKLDHFIMFIDENKKSLDGFTADINVQFDYVAKLQAFGFNSVRVDGHSTAAIKAAVEAAKSNRGKPTAIILDTVKSKGVPLLEKLADNHHIRQTPEITAAVAERIEILKKELT